MLTSASPVQLPCWDLTPFYPSPDSEECARDVTSVVEEIADLTVFFDRCSIGRETARPLDEATIATFEEVIGRYNALLAHANTVGVYLHCVTAADAGDLGAQRQLSALQQRGISVPSYPVRVGGLHARFVAWIGSLDVDGLIAGSPVARDHAYVLRKARVQAAHLMSQEAEEVSAALNAAGAVAWSKLHGTVTAGLVVKLERDGRMDSLPMSAVTTLAYDGDRALRRHAHDAGLTAWEGVAVPLAAALNGVKGAQVSLARRRGWASPLDQALLDNGIDQTMLDAMLDAVRATFPAMRRFWRAKARALGLPMLARYDLNAPLGTEAQQWSFEAAHAFIGEQFARYSPRLGALANRAFRERWIDAGPRPGKQGGGFSLRVRDDQSRILYNYSPSFTGMRHIAHELGHAYHDMLLASHAMLQQETPMALGETASIFCEIIVVQAALARADAAERPAILNESLSSAAQTVDLWCRFLFERLVCEAREAGELSIDELKALMIEAQRQTYGDGIDPSTYHPFLWAGVPHFYIPDQPFYNFPYTFGWLFALGLYARYQRDPDAFRVQFDELLSSTGLADPATLAERVGIDLRAPDFWRSSLDIVRGDIDRFEALVDPGQRELDEQAQPSRSSMCHPE